MFPPTTRSTATSKRLTPTAAYLAMASALVASTFDQTTTLQEGRSAIVGIAQSRNLDKRPGGTREECLQRHLPRCVTLPWKSTKVPMVSLESVRVRVRVMV